MHKHILNRLSKFTTPLLVVGLVVFGLAVATQMADATRDNDGEHKVNICHATDSDTNPYVKKTDVDFSSILGQNGHDGHNGGVYPSDPWGDIIPPFEYKTWEVVGSHQECPANSSAYNSSNSSKPCKKWKVWHWQYAEYITVNDYDWVTHQYPGKNWPEGEAIYNNGCQIPSPAIEAQKVICDAEQYLPNGQVSDPITDQTATDYVENSDGHCWLAEDWNFKWWWGNAGKHQFSVSSPATIPTDKGTIKVMEVLPDDYLGFSNSSNDYTAEFYCGNDVTNYDNEEWLTGVKLGMTYQCVGFNVEKTYCGDGVLQTTNDYNETEECDGTDGIEGNQICSRSCEILEPATVNAQKVVCKNESDLPNYGDGGPNMTATTAQDWVDQSAGNCWLAEWDFQIAPNNTPNVDTLFSGEAGAPWTTFSGSTEVAAYTDKVWLREVWNEDYIPFSGDTTSNPWDEYSAEFYCGGEENNYDVLNYDNYDWIVDLQPGQDYYCVGWNVMKTGTVTFYKDVRWNNDKIDIEDNQAFGVEIDGYGNVGNVSENSPLTIELPIGNYSAEEVLPAGYEGLVNTADFEVVWSQEKSEGTDVYFENKLSCSEGATWAYEVTNFNQGLTRDGQEVNSVSPNRSDPMAAVGPEDGNSVGTFVSLGKEGSLTVKFQHSVMDGEGDDISVHETTNGSYPEETALVEVSYDGITWYELGTASNLNAGANSYFDLATISLPIVNYVRLTDTTDFGLFTESKYSNADGFDVDAIDAVHGLCENVELYDLHGYKWHDANGNGYRDCSDQGEFTITSVNENIYDLPKLCETYSEDLLPGWTIFLDENLNETLDPGEPSMLTDDSDHFGWYWFENMLAGTYQVCEVVPADWQQTYPYFNEGVMCHTVTLPYGNDGDTCVPQYDLRQAAVQNAVAGPMCNFGNRLAPDLSIVKSVLVNGQESAVAEEGDTLTYTITVSNTGDAEATNLYLEDTTPTNTTLVADSWGGDLGDPVMNPDDSFTFGPFSLASGETISVTFDVTVNAGLPIGVTNIENQATLYQAPEEEAEENLEATNFLQKLFGIRAATAAEANWSMIAQSNIVLTTVTIPEPEPEPEQPQGQVLGDETVPALSIEKTVNKAFANAGDTVTYTIVVTNTGDALAEGVTLIDTLPAGMHYTDTVAMDHSWVLGDIMDGDSKTVTYDVVINKGATPGSYTNTVVGWAAGVDNVTDTATLEVRLGAVLGAETLPVTGAGAATLAISTLAGLAAVILTNRKRK